MGQPEHLAWLPAVVAGVGGHSKCLCGDNSLYENQIPGVRPGHPVVDQRY